MFRRPTKLCPTVFIMFVVCESGWCELYTSLSSLVISHSSVMVNFYDYDFFIEETVYDFLNESTYEGSLSPIFGVC